MTDYKFKQRQIIREYQKKYWKNQHKEFMKMMDGLIERYKNDVKENKSNFPIKEWKDEKFKIWHIIKEAYDEGRSMGNRYLREAFFELTDAEEYFRDKVRREI